MKSKTDKMGFPPGTALNLLVGVSIIFFIQPRLYLLIEVSIM